MGQRQEMFLDTTINLNTMICATDVAELAAEPQLCYASLSSRVINKKGYLIYRTANFV